MIPPTQLKPRKTITIIVLVVLISASLLVQATFAGPPTAERVSIDSNGVEGDSDSITPSVSANGRFIAFASNATNLVPDDSNGYQDIFLHDWMDGTTERISVGIDGSEPNGDSAWPSISADGNYIAYSSTASNLVLGDTNEVQDVFLYNRATGDTERISMTTYGGQSNGDSYEPVVSADGSYLAFVSIATNLVSDPYLGVEEIYFLDRGNNELKWVSHSPATNPNNDFSSEISMSTNGEWVAFSSRKSNLVPGDHNGVRDIFVWNRDSEALERVSLTYMGAEANGSSYHPAISDDGNLIAFRSHATNLVLVPDTNFSDDIFIHDRRYGATERVNVPYDGEEEVLKLSDSPDISADGRFVTFTSTVSNLVSGDTNGIVDIFVRDMEGGTTLVSKNNESEQANKQNFRPAISADGSVVVFYSDADNLDLVREDTNGNSDVFSQGDKPTPEPTPTPTETATVTPTDTPEPTVTDTPEPTVTDTPEPTVTDTPIPTETDTPVPTETDTPVPTETDTPVPTETDTPVPTETDTPQPTETDTPEPTETPDPTETSTPDPTQSATPDPTEPSHQETWRLDFESGSSGAPLTAGTIIDDEWASFGITVSTGDPEHHPVMVFDSGNPTGFDYDLGSPNQDFGGPGQGSGGEAGMPGENSEALGNILILTEDMDSSDPDDYHAGGSIQFTFGDPVSIHAVQLLDIDLNETGGKIFAFDLDGDRIGSFSMLPYGNNSVQWVLIELENVSELRVEIPSSGALAALEFHGERPAGTLPGPEPTETEEPTPPVEPSEPPLIEVQNRLKLMEGETFEFSGTFVDPDSSSWTAAVDFDDGAGFQDIDPPVEETFTVEGVYGDNGEYELTIRVEDDSGTAGTAVVLVTVENDDPSITSGPNQNMEGFEITLSSDGSKLASGVGDWIVARVDEPTVFTFQLEDPGSDDLTVGWDFGPEKTYLNNGTEPDSNPSPLGTFPYIVGHTAEVTFEKPGVKHVQIEVLDDDGGKATTEFKVLVRNNQSCQTSLGEWISYFMRKNKDAGLEGELRAHLSILSGFISSAFDEMDEKSLEQLEDFVLTEMDQPARARAEMLTAWLNFMNGSVEWEDMIEDADGERDLTYAETLHKILSILLEDDVSSKKLQEAIDLAKAINHSNHGGGTCSK